MNKLTFVLLCALFFGSCTDKPSETVVPWDNCFSGLSNHGQTGEKPYATSGRMAKIIGKQNADFPDMGEHVKDEMGGVWTGSFKIADGYWFKLADITTNEDSILKANEFIVYPHCSKFDFGQVLNGVSVCATQFCSDNFPGAVVSYTLTNNSQKDLSLSVGFLLNVDIFPVWFSEENGIENGADIIEWDEKGEMFTARDSVNNWFAAWKCNYKISSYEQNESHVYNKGAIPTGIYSTIKLKAGESETISYSMASSIENKQKAMENCCELLNNYEAELADKELSIREMLSHSEIEIPNKNIQNAYYWTLINNRWLENKIDTLGYFLSAGAIEYPWLFGCDNTYSLQGQLRVGGFELTKSTLRMLNEISDKVNKNGRIIHEMSNNGFVGNKGNTQETAHFVMALWDTYKWTGETAFLKSIYPSIKKSISWLTDSMDINRNMYPEGYGIMEVKGLNAELIDVAVYTQQALDAASRMASLFDEDSLSEVYSRKAVLLKEKINKDFWDDKARSYCDFYGSRSMAQKVALGAIEQIQSTGDTGKNNILDFYKKLYADIAGGDKNEYRGWFTNQNWVVSTPMECQIAPVDRGLIALENVYMNNCGKYGPYLSAVERKHMMTISTGVQAIAEANYRRIDRAVEYLEMISNTLGVNMPGAICEMMPDYGCPYQAWTIYGMARGLVSGCFGIDPMASEHKIWISPQLPSAWDNMSIKNVAVGNNAISLALRKEKGDIIINYSSREAGWTSDLYWPNIKGKQLIINGQPATVASDTISLSEKQYEICIPE